MGNARLDEAQAGIKISRRNINNLRCADDITLMAESKEELKSLLMKVKEEREKVGLKLSIQKSKIMVSSPIISWQIDGETGEGNGNPLQCSCLENPRDGGASWAAVYGVAQSRTRLKRLSSSSSRWGNNGNSVRFYFFLALKSLQMVTAAMKLKQAYSLQGKL